MLMLSALGIGDIEVVDKNQEMCSQAIVDIAAIATHFYYSWLLTRNKPTLTP